MASDSQKTHLGDVPWSSKLKSISVGAVTQPAHGRLLGVQGDVSTFWGLIVKSCTTPHAIHIYYLIYTRSWVKQALVFNKRK